MPMSRPSQDAARRWAAPHGIVCKAAGNGAALAVSIRYT